MAETTAQVALDWRGQIRDTLSGMRTNLEDTTKGVGVLVDARNVVKGMQTAATSLFKPAVAAQAQIVRDSLQAAVNAIDAALSLIPPNSSSPTP